MYDILTNTWKIVAPLPIPWNHPNVAGVDGKLYVLGGDIAPPGSNPEDWVAIPNCWVYDPQTDSWTAIESMPSAYRGASATGTYKKKISLAGGNPAAAGVSVDNVSMFDTALGEWVELPKPAANISGPRDHVGGAVVGHRFFVIGGRNTIVDDVKDDVLVLDLQNLGSGWSSSATKMPTARGGLSVAAVGRFIYAFGGEGNQQSDTGVFNETEVYDTISDKWTSLLPMERPKYGTRVAEVGGKVYIPGGVVV